MTQLSRIFCVLSQRKCLHENRASCRIQLFNKSHILFASLSIPYFSIKVSYDRSFQKVVTFKRP